MASAKKKLIIKAVSWSKRAEEVLKNATGEDEEYIRRDVKANIATLFKVIYDRKILLYYVLRVDNHEGVVVVAQAVANKGLNLVEAILPVMEKQFVGIKKIRLHTSRMGMVKKTAKLGYKFKEFVMEKTLES